MKTQVIEISPSIAREFLSISDRNRDIKEWHVNNFYTDMINGKWIENTGETIKISKSGKLIDGQHRLIALIKADKTYNFLVAYEIDDDAFDIIDSGVRRTIKDVFTMDGVVNSGAIITTIRSVYYLEKKQYAFVGSSDNNLSARDVLKLYKIHPESYHESALFGASIYKLSQKLVHARIACSFHYLCKTNYKYEIEAFLTQLASGLNILDNNSPIHHMRNRLVNDLKDKSRKLNSKLLTCLYIKSWNAYITGKNIKLLKYNPNEEDLPILITHRIK